MRREFDDWADFPPPQSGPRPTTNPHRVEEIVNRCAERFLEAIVAVGPWFYTALFLAYLAVSFGIIS